ncbi:MAG: metal-dependent hydrolase [Trebonia sp.]
MTISPLTVSPPADLVLSPGWLHDAGSVLGGIFLVVLGAFAARLPDVDLRVGLLHRGATHSLAALAAATVVASLVTVAVVPAAAVDAAAVVGAAYLSHLMADLTNPTPMALGWPYSKRIRPHWLPAVREASLWGRVVEAMVVLAIVGAVAWRLLQALHPR